MCRWARAIRAVLAVCSIAPWVSPAAADGGGLETYGDIGQIAIPVAAAAISVVRQDTDGLLQLGVSAAVSEGIVQVLKLSIDAERPNGGDRAFPSGHTARAFVGASYLHYRYGWQWGLPAYGAASLVGYSRVDADEHRWRDVVGAAAIANVVAYVLTDTLDDSVVIIPVIDAGKKNFGIIASIRF